MEQIIDRLNDAALIVQALATVVLVIATWILAKATVNLANSSSESSEATKLLAQESRRAREDEYKPRVSARLKPSSHHGEFIRLVVANLGRGPAVDLEIKLECDEDDFTKHEVMPIRGTSAPIGFLSRGESDTYSLGTSRSLFADPPIKPFAVVLRYKDLDGNSYDDRVNLDIKQFKGLTWPGASVAWRQMQALERIDKQVVKLLGSVRSLKKIERHMTNLVRGARSADIIARYVLARWRLEHRRSGIIENLPEKFRDSKRDHDDTQSWN